jgi:hypothetical protein
MAFDAELLAVVMTSCEDVTAEFLRISGAHERMAFMHIGYATSDEVVAALKEKPEGERAFTDSEVQTIVSTVGSHMAPIQECAVRLQKYPKREVEKRAAVIQGL